MATRCFKSHTIGFPSISSRSLWKQKPLASGWPQEKMGQEKEENSVMSYQLSNDHRLCRSRPRAAVVEEHRRRVGLEDRVASRLRYMELAQYFNRLVQGCEDSRTLPGTGPSRNEGLRSRRQSVWARVEGGTSEPHGFDLGLSKSSSSRLFYDHR